MNRLLKKNGKVYKITFNPEEKLLSLKNKVVKSILSHEDEIRCGTVPKGFEKV